MPLSRKALGPGRLVNALGSRGVTGWVACLKKRVTSAVCRRGQLGQSKMCSSTQIACRSPDPCLIDLLFIAMQVRCSQCGGRSGQSCRSELTQLADEMLLFQIRMPILASSQQMCSEYCSLSGIAPADHKAHTLHMSSTCEPLQAHVCTDTCTLNVCTTGRNQCMRSEALAGVLLQSMLHDHV